MADMSTEARAPGEDVEGLAKALDKCAKDADDGEWMWTADIIAKGAATLRDLSRKLEEMPLLELDREKWWRQATDALTRAEAAEAALEEARRERQKAMRALHKAAVREGATLEALVKAGEAHAVEEYDEAYHLLYWLLVDHYGMSQLPGGPFAAALCALSPQTEERDALGCLWCDKPAAPASNLCPQHREQFVTGKRAP